MPHRKVPYTAIMFARNVGIQKIDTVFLCRNSSVIDRQKPRAKR